ncbi:Lrp/AsnC family transcriptional regulator, partial [Salmonella enterica subsp. enterica serovar Heidelberg]
MTEYLDDKDKELLKEIQKDCAQTLRQLAYKV